jgi:hypothetical protein
MYSQSEIPPEFDINEINSLLLGRESHTQDGVICGSYGSLLGLVWNAWKAVRNRVFVPPSKSDMTSQKRIHVEDI